MLDIVKTFTRKCISFLLKLLIIIYIQFITYMLIKYAESQLFYSTILYVNEKKCRPKTFRVLENQTLTINFKI